MAKILSTQEVIKRFKDVHGDMYDYSLVQYKSKSDVVKIICRTHGEFEQGAGAHWYGSKCPKCIGRNLNTDDVIKRFKDVHGDMYDYSLVNYKSARAQVKIICKTHGEFKQTPLSHWNKSGCPKCANDIISDKNSLSSNEVLSRFKDVHGDTYDYSLVNYKNKNSNIKIICKKHGMFTQLATLHWAGNGCSKCENEKLTNDAIRRFIAVHGDTYDYSLVDYKNNQTKVSIICKIHGEFKQTPNGHQSRKNGCPICGAIRQGNIGNTSELEYKIIEILKHNNIQFKHSDRTILFPQELDIIIPQKNIAIEVNGIYWHSEIFKTTTYHKDKTLACSNKNIQLLQFWEHEINNNFELVSSMIMAKLGQSDKIFARKCVIREVANVDAKSFENHNHLQGACAAKIKLGLFYNDDLVSLMTFSKPRFNRNYEWELIRFCNKMNITVVGGASKLFKHFIKNYMQENDKIISYANLRISNGNLYEALGFTKIGLTPPNYFYFGNKGILQRYQAQKHKLEKLLGSNNFDENLTEHKNMHNNKYYRVYDCGNLVFEYNLNTEWSKLK